MVREEDECKASYCCDEDSCGHGVNLGIAYHTFVVGKYTIIATETEHDLENIYSSVDADYCLPQEVTLQMSI